MKINLRVVVSLMLLCWMVCAYAQERDGEVEVLCDTVNYGLMIYQDRDGLNFDRPTSGGVTKRGLWEDYGVIASNMRYGIAESLFSAGMDMLVDGIKGHRKDWMTQTSKECKFTKTFFMPQEIGDFYVATSDEGATDFNGMRFTGFGCKQFYTARGVENGGHGAERDTTIVALDMKCSLRRDSIGRARMYNHGMFEMVLDYFYFNPSKSSLPNDSLGAAKLTPDEIREMRIPFDFKRRRNLKINIKAEVMSSWLNEAIQVTQNQKLGEFNVSVCIPDSSYLYLSDGGDECFLYVRDEEVLKECPYVKGHDSSLILAKSIELKSKESKGFASVSGESFLVPRSFIGFEDEHGYKRVWGTGYYKIDMTLSESCDINDDFYKVRPDWIGGLEGEGGALAMGDGGKREKWNGNWREEWKRMRRRPNFEGGVMQKYFSPVWKELMTEYVDDGRWAYILTEPIENAVLLRVGGQLKSNTSASSLQASGASKGASSIGQAAGAM